MSSGLTDEERQMLLSGNLDDGVCRCSENECLGVVFPKSNFAPVGDIVNRDEYQDEYYKCLDAMNTYVSENSIGPVVVVACGSDVIESQLKEAQWSVVTVTKDDEENVKVAVGGVWSVGRLKDDLTKQEQKLEIFNEPKPKYTANGRLKKR